VCIIIIIIIRSPKSDEYEPNLACGLRRLTSERRSIYSSAVLRVAKTAKSKMKANRNVSTSSLSRDQKAVVTELKIKPKQAATFLCWQHVYIGPLSTRPVKIRISLLMTHVSTVLLFHAWKRSKEEFLWHSHNIYFEKPTKPFGYI